MISQDLLDKLMMLSERLALEVLRYNGTTALNNLAGEVLNAVDEIDYDQYQIVADMANLNQETIDKLKEMYDNDINTPEANGDKQTNLYGSKGDKSE